MGTTATPKAITVDGVTPTYNTAASGDKVAAGGRGVFVTVKNGGAAPVTLTVNPPGKTQYGVANPAKTWSIAAAGEQDIPMLAAYGDPSDGGRIALGWSATASVTWAAKQIGVV
ncbi:hypothetical protein [Actinoallomurus sp. CA-142502]|uniref:hypothetical protein n=1 Tax=Actinoallomurus sp. CA-142502 TaxID=3239885 RepID=UPI003D8F64FE